MRNWLTPSIVEAEKSRDILSAGWRPRKTCVVIQSQSEGLRTRGADDVNPSLRAREDRSQLKQWGRKKGVNFSFLHLLFYSVPNGLDEAHPYWGGKSTLLRPQIEMPVSSRNTFTDTPRNND